MSATPPALPAILLAERNRPLRLLVCAMLAAILYLPALGRPALWEPDEGRYAEIAREMVLTHDYVTPHDNWVRYFEKPPLVYWAEALSIKLLGANELAVRLPAALASVAEVAVTAALGEAMFGAAVGLAAAMVLGLSPLVFGFARFATLDPALALFITAALGAFWAAARAPGFDGAAGRRWFLLSAAMAAAGTLTKGPVALVLDGRGRARLAAGRAARARDSPDAVARRDRDLYRDRRAMVRARGAAQSGISALLFHPRTRRALSGKRRARMGSVLFRGGGDSRDVAVDLFRPDGRARTDASAGRRR